MEERELIQMTIQLPVEALYNFTRLIEQLRKLSESTGVNPSPAARTAEERVENSTFDPERYRLLSREPEAPRSVQAAPASSGEARAVRQEVRRDVPQPDSAGEAASAAAEAIAERVEALRPPAPEAELPRQAEPPREERPPEAQQPEERPTEEAGDAEAVQVEDAVQTPEARSVQAEPDSPVDDAPAVRMEPESQIPAAEAAWAEMEDRELEAPVHRTEPGPAAETPLGAGVVVSSGADTPSSRWTGVSEELVTPGAAPLTAEAVSLAFRRDGRRYDNGFPLY